MEEVEQGQVQEVVIQGRNIEGFMLDGRHFSLYAPEDQSMVSMLRKNNVRITAVPDDGEVPTIWSVLISWFPMLLLIGVWIFFMRQMQSGNGKAMSFGKSRARLDDAQKRVTFEDVAGVEEGKQELEEVVDFLKAPQKYQRLGGKIPKGILLTGPSGTGKTLLARAVAGEAEVPFFTISGSDFVEMFVGVGASRVRDMFEEGKKNAPCIIFIDEIDAVGRHRGAGLGGGNDEREQTLNQLLVEMDGFEVNEGVILIAATNRPDVLDPALLRPGRFDRQVVVPLPDVRGREQILKVHLKKVQVSPDVNAKIIARGTPGLSGADLANIVNESALMAARREKRFVTMTELEQAKDKILMGVERRSMVMSEDEKKNTAYHEAGHAVCAIHEKESDPVHKATIIPRGRALGLVMRLPEEDRLSHSKARLYAELTIAMGGRVAEELIFGSDNVTTGASQDIKMATSMARSMVTEWGMSDKLGPIEYGEREDEVFLGRSVTQHKPLADATVLEVDKEVKRLVEEGYERARKILTEYHNELELLGNALIEYETLNGDEIKAVLAGESIDTDSSDSSEDSGIKSSVPTSGESDDVSKGMGLDPEPEPSV